jgi:small subunit ribosomal protein S6
LAAYVYEGMVILDSNRYARDPEGVSGQITKVIQELGGEVLVSRPWEERRLAYPIKGQRKGTYWLTYFRLEGPRLAEVRRRCYLSESILRVLLLKVDPRIVDTLVEHALSGQIVQSRAAAIEPTAEPSPVEQALAAIEGSAPRRGRRDE